jgi:hypothetical protein
MLLHMSRWHVWGDFVHTLPDTIGNARIVTGEGKAAQRTAESQGFNFDKRVRNGFEPWAEAYVSEDDSGQEFAFAAYPVVRGWSRL